MKLPLPFQATLALLAAFLTAMLVTVAAALTPSEVLLDCPDVPAAVACTSLADEFVDERSAGAQRDAEIVRLVDMIAQAAQAPDVPMEACLNAADGLRILAQGMQNAGQAAQIRDIADSLCLGLETAAIGDGGPPPASLSSPGTSGGSGPPNDDDVPPPNDDDVLPNDDDDVLPNDDDDDVPPPNDDDDDDDDDDDGPCPPASDAGQGGVSGQDPPGNACGIN